jgi:hypothetical protein
MKPKTTQKPIISIRLYPRSITPLSTKSPLQTCLRNHKEIKDSQITSSLTSLKHQNLIAKSVNANLKCDTTRKSNSRLKKNKNKHPSEKSIGFSTERMTIPNGQQELVVRNISYELIKAKSDLLELKRDLATFDYSLITENSFGTAICKIQGMSNKLCNIVASNEKGNKGNLANDINNTLENGFAVSSKCMQMNKNSIISVSEDFGVRPQQRKNLVENFAGIVRISNLTCLVSVYSKDRQFHTISCSANNHILSLSIQVPINSFFCYKSQLLTEIFPKLFLCSNSHQYSLHFDSEHNKSYIIIIESIKGIGKVFIKLTELPDAMEIKLLKINCTLLLLYSSYPQLSLKNLTELISFLKCNLCFDSNSLIVSSNPFISKEKTSTLMNDSYLSTLFENHMKPLYSFSTRRNGKLFEITFFSDKVLQIIFKRQQKVTITENSPYFTFLTSMQGVSLLYSKRTLQQSLEFRSLLKTLFFL